MSTQHGSYLVEGVILGRPFQIEGFFGGKSAKTETTNFGFLFLVNLHNRIFSIDKLNKKGYN